MPTVNQPSANPTRKLSAAVITAAAMNVAKIIMINTAPQWYDPELWAALDPIVIFAVGYFVKDQPNA